MSFALLFPGQGSQHVGMGQFLYNEFASARTVFEEASDSLSFDMKKLCFDADEKTLSLTENTQPALLTVSIATYRVLCELREMNVTAGAGHSVGEYAALVAAGVLTLADGVRLVRHRGQYMQEAVPVGKGGMLAVVGAPSQVVTEICQWVEKESGLSPVEPANYNSLDQTVISGDAEALAWARKNVKPENFAIEGKLRLIPLKVSAPFHCSMMKPAQEKMALLLNDTPFSEPQWPVIQNVTAGSSTQTDEIRRCITEQISGAVKWLQSMQALMTQKPGYYVECGSGKVLSGLLKKIDSEVGPALNINSLEELKAIEAL